ncbi:MAG: flagellar biosynthesis protein FlhA [Myxococcales bacterium]|nr:flagellar biosynthesis protein FlhA [Myxococcales bacterium]
MLRARPRWADGALALLLLAIVGTMIVPLPTTLLDLLIASNIALSVLMLLTAMTVGDGLAFAAMPTVLLVTTLYRLALNVSSTRLILLQADAGEVIAAFGDFVVRGNYVVGAVIFLILTLIQYVVVARGAERVAEVGARFTLDAMPGKQLAIDAEQRSFALSAVEAAVRRRALEREGQFYGAMDGAMKFVKGDAIASIAITAINIVAGAGIGVGMGELSLKDSLALYGLLTIGDGLVSQIPSLLVSVSAGIVVTRVASEHDDGSLGADIGSQLFGDPRVLRLAAGFLLLLALVPGLPALPFAVLGLVLGASAQATARLERRRGQRALLADRSGDTDSEGPPPELSLLLSPELAAAMPAGELQRKLQLERDQVRILRGLSLPPLHLEVDPRLQGRRYRLELASVTRSQGELPALDAAATAATLAGALREQCLRHGAELLGLQATQELLDALARQHPALVRHTVPHPIPLERLSQILRALLAEGVSVRPLRQILEALLESQPEGAEVGALIERVRRRLLRQICANHVREGVLSVHPIDPMIEEALRDASAAGGAFALSPDLADEIVDSVARRFGDARGGVLVVQADVRPLLRRLLADQLPQVPVLAYPEIAPELEIERHPAIAP